MNELKPKLFDVLKDYSKEQAMRDVISGIIVAIIALPLSIALAIASGVGPEQGLYTAIDASAMKSLRELADRAKKKKITLIFSHVNEQPMSVMVKDGFTEYVGAPNFHANIVEALDYAESLVK